MGYHVRRQLRDAVGNALGALATTGPHVFKSRVYPLQSEDLPGLRLYTNDETAAALTVTNPTSYERDLELVIEACVRQADDMDDELDQIMLEVEAALADGVVLGGRNVWLNYGGCSIEMDDTAQQPQGVAHMTFTAKLFTAAAAPDALL